MGTSLDAYELNHESASTSMNITRFISFFVYRRQSWYHFRIL